MRRRVPNMTSHAASPQVEIRTGEGNRFLEIRASLYNFVFEPLLNDIKGVFLGCCVSLLEKVFNIVSRAVFNLHGP